MNISGQCHCGAIRFTAQIDPSRVFLCHCTDCQAMSGGPCRANVPVPIGQVVLHGEPQLYVKTADSGHRRAQAFCRDCGTQLYAADAEVPQMLNFRLGCVNERAELPPAVQMWAHSAMPWLSALTGIPAHPRGKNRPPP